MTAWTRVPPDDPRLASLADLPRAAAVSTAIVVEGELALRRAIAAGHRAQLVVATPACAARLDDVGEPPLAAILDAGALSQLVGFEFHRGCLAVLPRPAPAAWRAALDGLLARPSARVIALDRVADAQNVGAVIRTARALGVDLLLLGRGCADPWSRRVIRASMGHALVQPLCAEVDLAAAIGATSPALTWWATGAVGTGPPLRPGVPPPPRPAHLGVVFGNEGDGVSAPVAAGCVHTLAIETRAGAESLNVAAAAAIVIWSVIAGA